MRIIFIENRFRTLFWRAMADLLRKDGHEVKIIVQNHSFSEGDKNDIVIPYPKKMRGKTQDRRNFPLIESDRNINYFGHMDSIHYDYYRTQLENIITQISPDIVFGESTAFHELLTIDICKEKHILYLQPSSCRYPTGRFSFYKYDTLEPYMGSGDKLTEKESCQIIEGIIKRSTKPDYMVKKKSNGRMKFNRFKDLIKHTLAYYKGEHYNTPNPIVKQKIEKAKDKLISEWDSISLLRRGMEKDYSFRILYPMQMQPEANLDVWGRKFRDQLKTIKSIVDNTSTDVTIIVKPNPKSKYELTPDLIDYIKSEERVIPIEHSVKMDDVLPNMDMVITATGTIAIECILSNIPVLTLVETINNNSKNCVFLEKFHDLPKFIEMVKNHSFPTSVESAKQKFIGLLNATSYKGRPYNSTMTSSNLENCLVAFQNILSSIDYMDRHNSL